MVKLLKKSMLCVLSLILTQNLFAQNTKLFAANNSEKSNKTDESTQYTKLSADLNVGLPYMFNTIGYSPSIMAGISARYSFTKALSLQLGYSIGQFNGSQTTPDTITDRYLGLNRSVNVKEFSTFVTTISVKGLINLRKLFSAPDELNKWNYYAVVGLGFITYRNENTLADNSKTQLNYQLGAGKGASYLGTLTEVIGFQARKHLNKKWDFLAGVDFNYNQSKWLAGYKADAVNYMVNVNAGISYKFFTDNRKELIDWSYNNYKVADEVKVADIPVIDKPKVVDVPKEEPKMEVVAPVVVPEPVAPIKVEPVVVPEPVVPPVVVPEPVAPKVEPVIVPTPKVEPIVTELENKETVTEPDGKYNVVVACYGLNHLDLAMKFRDQVRNKGYKANVYRSLGSKYYRVMTTSGNDSKSALGILKKSKVDIDPLSWYYVYNKQ